ncbi:MAG: SURF1 family protein [Pseudomonadota bacterium]
MRGSTLLVLACMFVGLLVLGALGTWQVKRMLWKEDLIEQVNNRISQQPVNLLDLLSNPVAKESHEYIPVSASGTFDHESEVYFFTTGRTGRSGWNVHTPLILENGKALIVNRGFVPFEMKSPSERLEGQLESSQSVTGLLRFPLLEKPFGSLENSLDSREFYWRNVAEMSSLMGSDDGLEFLPVIVDANDAPNPGGWPQGATTIISFPNNHLQYAITWYGLALTLLGVGGFFLYSRRGTENE